MRAAIPATVVCLLGLAVEAGAAVWFASVDKHTRQEAYAVAIDGTGAVALAGKVYHVFDEDQYGGQFAVQRVRVEDGVMLWQKILTGDFSSANAFPDSALEVENAAVSVATAADGSVFACGHVRNGDYTTARDPIVAKFSAADGSILWRKEFAVAEAGEAYKIVVDTAGDAFVAGYQSGAFVTKLSGIDGQVLWEKPLAGVGVVSLALDADENILAAGLSYPTPTGMKTAKLANADGATLWETTVTGARLKDVTVDSSGDVFIVGTIENATYDFTVAKLAGVDGQQLWLHVFDGPDSAGPTVCPDVGRAIAVHPSGDVLAGGESNCEPIVLRLASATGTEIWRKQFTGVSGSVEAVDTVPSGDIVVAIGVDWDRFIGIPAPSIPFEPAFAVVGLAAANGDIVWAERGKNVELFRSSDSGGAFALDIDPLGLIVAGGAISTQPFSLAVRPSRVRRAIFAVAGLNTPADAEIRFSAESYIPQVSSIDPLNDGVRMVATNNNGDVVLDITIPGGAYDPGLERGWSVNSHSTRWTYRDSSGAVGGIHRVIIRDMSSRSSVPLAGGSVKVSVRGRQGNYPLSISDAPLTVGLFFNDATGRGPEAIFNTSTFPRPRCRANASGDALRCH